MDWKAIVKSVAPVIGAALGGPLAGTAVKVLADGLLGNPDATEGDVAAAIMGASPDQLLKIKELDVTFKTRMRELDIDVFRLEVSDRTSARDMAKVDMRPQIILSALYTVGYLAMLYLFVAGEIEVNAMFRDQFGVLLGVLTAAQVKIMDFWFGSSYGSRLKDGKE